MKVRKVNGTRKLFGYVVYHIPVGNDFDAEGFAYIKQGGEYRRLPFKVPKKKFCDFFFQELYFYPEFRKVSDFPPPDYKYCPLANVCARMGMKLTVLTAFTYREPITLMATNQS